MPLEYSQGIASEIAGEKALATCSHRTHTRNDVVFVFPPASGRAGSFANHLGVGYLRAALAESGIKSGQYLNDHPGTVGEVARDLLSLKPGIIGFTAYNDNFPLCLSIARAVKQWQPSTKIVFGGPTVTFGANELLARHHVIDLCVLGESEDTAPQVLGNLLNGFPPREDQPGVAFRKDGEVICTADPPLVGGGDPSNHSALDITPSPYLAGILHDGRTGLLTGRGCTHQCQYCCFAALGRKTLRLHSLERVIAELEFIARHQRRSGQEYPVPVHDDAFTLLPDRAKRLCEMIIHRGVKLTLSCCTRADTIDDELLELMRGAGFKDLAFGLESAVPSVLRATGKVRPPDWPNHDLSPERLFLERFRQSVISAKKLGFTVGISIILGLPAETPADGETTLHFVSTLPVDYYAHNFLCLLPGTPLWDTCARYGLDRTIDRIGLPVTTRYSYEVTRLRPRSRCILERKAGFVRMLATDAVCDCEAASATGESISTVVIEAEELTAEAAEWLSRVLAVGGMVLQLYARMKRGLCERQIARDRQMMDEHLVPACYYIQMEQKQDPTGNTRYRCAGPFVDLYRRHKPRLVSMVSADGSSPMFAWLRGISTPCELCRVSPELLRSAAFARLTREIESRSGGSPLQRMVAPPRFRYSGSWLKESVTCSSLNRLEVDYAGNVRTCRFGEPIGMVGDTKKELKARFLKLAQAVQQRRGCSCCKESECPRCLFPGYDDQTYCGTIKRCAPALGTLKSIRVYSRLISRLAYQREDVD